jgi:ABC-type antimicrobial peptide transport system permease subunit
VKTEVYIILQNVLHRPIRALVAIIGVAVEVMFVVLIAGLNTGLLPEHPKRTDNVGADMVIKTHSASVGAVMICMVLAVAFLVIFLSMYRAVIGRTYEIGVLKSLGASKHYIVGIILGETTLICLAGIAAGVTLSYALRAIIRAIYYYLPIQIALTWIVLAGLTAITGASLGAVSAAWIASCKDPVEILPYE